MQKVKIRFAYKRGFRRIWLILSLLWLWFFAYASWNRAEGNIASFWDEFFYIGILPVVVIYALGAATVWIIEGFAKADR